MSRIGFVSLTLLWAVRGLSLLSVESGLTNYNSGAATYLYDGDGNRVRKTIGGTTTLYLVDDRNHSGYAQVLEELTVSGSSTNLSKLYAYGLDLISLRDAGTGTTYYFGYDGNGNTRYLTATNASVVNVFAYDAFGTLLASNAAPQTAYLFTGEQRDATLALYYLRARYLNADTDRFWTRDTHPGSNQDPLSLHKYLYAHGDPVNNTDPSGRVIVGSNLIYGNAVHRALGRHFEQTGPGRVYNLSIARILGVPWVPGVTASRPDLVQFPQWGNVRSSLRDQAFRIVCFRRRSTGILPRPAERVGSSAQNLAPRRPSDLLASNSNQLGRWSVRHCNPSRRGRDPVPGD